MKYLLNLIFFIRLSFYGYTQERNHYILKTSYFNYILTGGFNLAGEIQLNDKSSINISFEKGNWKDGISTRNWDKFQTVVVERRKYSYSSKNKPSGLFTSPYIKYRFKDKNQNESNGLFGWGAVDEDIYKSHSLGIGFLGGYQNHIFKRISVELKAGIGLLSNIKSTGTTKPNLIQPDGIIGLSFGLRL